MSFSLPTRLASQYLDDLPMVDAAFFLPHPGDAEILCGGTIRKLVEAGRKVAILDLTAGEAGTHSHLDIRLEQAEASAAFLGVAWRGSVRLPDARVEDTIHSRMSITGEVKRLRPRLLVGIHGGHPHPDAQPSMQLVENAAYLANLPRLDDYLEPHRPARIAFACAEAPVAPTYIVDISDQFEAKVEAARKHTALFTSETQFLTLLAARARHFGALIGVTYGEPFFERHPLKLDLP
ncbi:MAG: PIG-L family deacetylase [Bryobacter sp.]|nr:PIG-L family deacetylase [Bryobacter sp.]